MSMPSRLPQTQVTGWKVGSASVLRIEEVQGRYMRLSTLLPDLHPDALAEHQRWLTPQFHDPATGRFTTSVHSFVVRTGRHTILVDSCVGSGKYRPETPDFHLRDDGFLLRLAAAGVQPEQVDYVMCTHLHVDHVGWNTRLCDGRWVPTFPRAKYILGRVELEYWQGQVAQGSAPEADTQVYRDSVLPILEAGQAVLVDDGYALDDLMRVVLAPGHTPGSVWIELNAGEQGALFAGDILHHPLQVYHPDWNSRWCMDPALARQSRWRALEACADRRWLLMPSHFAVPHVGRVHTTRDAFRIDFERQPES